MLLLLLFYYVSSFKIHAYFGIFDQGYNNTINTTIPWSMFDRIIISFSNLDENGRMFNERVTDDERLHRVASYYKQHKPDGEVHISLYDEREERFLTAAKNTRLFNTSVFKYLNRYRLNGLDLDWETVAINDYNKTLLTLITSCYQKINITHAIWPYVHNPATVGLIKNVVNQIHIMSYQMPIHSIENLINDYHHYGFPYQKMVLGIETESGEETNETISDKIKLIKKYQLYGLFVWRLDNDAHFKTVNMIKQFI
ncbi:MAG TPA: glycosyl hydrolase family 18 protein [Candidatus Saccharimonadales bacterium]|nr:glycosyl hydrolase family 18 protein [Candidatus Saccharimonadales bacterium]